MSTRILLLVLALLSFQLSPFIPQAQTQDGESLLLAFPGAEGFGACTPGGRGGRVYYVTTLEDYEPGKESPIEGSLRSAVDAKGPRVVLFEVGGTISLKADLWVREPYLTLAGQTAPGGGICLKDYQFVIATHDVIVRHVRFRSGDLTRKEQMSVGIFGGSNSILDHCSMTWAIDEVMSMFGARNITVQWSIVSEGLSRSYHPKGEHSKGSIIDGNGGVTIHHCLYAHNAARNPRVNTLIMDFRNNVLYNWGYRAAYTTEAPSYVNWVANYLKPGPSTRSSARKKVFDPGDDLPRVFIEGNFLEGFEKETRDNRLMISAPNKETADEFRSMIAVQEPFLSPSVPTHSATEALELILTDVGATLPARDSADLRLVEEVRSGSGKIIDSPSEVGGWPELAGDAPRLDTERDGMPDEWESVHQFNPELGTDGSGDSDGDGYTNLEEYLNQTDPRVPETGCRVDAKSFRSIQENAIKQSAEGMREFKELLAQRESARGRRNEGRVAALDVVISPTAAADAPQVEIIVDGTPVMEMVRIPAGSFLMGTPESEEGLVRERPQHKVNISKPFYFCTTKTTTEQFIAVLGPESRELTEENKDLPAKEVDWFEAVEFCEVLSRATGRKFRLPTEAEWEYACRAGTTTAFYTGDMITTDQANFDGSSATPFNPVGINRAKLTPAKMFPPNPWGLYDMHGNQAEYCQDCCFREYTKDEVTDPVGNLEGPCARVLRGGKATSKAYYLRSGYRYGYAPEVGYGFRVVLEAGP